MLTYKELWHYMVDLERYMIKSVEYHPAAEKYINNKLNEDEQISDDEKMQNVIKEL